MPSHCLHHKLFLGAPLPCCHRSSAGLRRAGALQVHSALSRKAKEAQVERLVSNFNNSALVFGVRFNQVKVKDFQAFRRSLPEEVQLMVCKNKLIEKAADQVEGWSEIKRGAKGENAWVFATEDTVAAAVKAFMEFEKKLKEPIPREQRAAAKPTDISGAVMDGQWLDYAKVLQLEKVPTKLELITSVAIMINKVPTRLAVSIKAVPTKLARAINLLAEGDDNKELIVGEVFPKAATVE